MKQLSTDQQTFEVTAGLDLGDKYSHLCLLETATGEILEEARLRTNPKTLKRRFGEMEPMRIAIPVSQGTLRRVRTPPGLAVR